jgi:hypothetical protein
MEKAGLPFPISISNGFTGKFLIELENGVITNQPKK